MSLSPTRPARLWSPRSIAILIGAWLALQLTGIFSPGLLDDVDSIYIEIARQMLLRHNYVTAYIDGIRFFDKPPLMYWIAAASMRIFGQTDYAARLPLALGVAALILATYALGIRLFRSASPTHAPDRGGFYSALALSTAIGPYLYTRFYIPDILIALWMTLGVHLFLIVIERARNHASTLLPSLGFAAVMALNVLTKGLIGAFFPIGFVILYLLITKQLRLARRFHLILGTLTFLAIAAPWHILAALQNPAIAMPFGVGLPARAGWAWFYLYNEHVARFFGTRVPHDYGQTQRLLFWIFAAIWIFPWVAFLPTAIAKHLRTLRSYLTRDDETSLTLLLWPLLVLGFFTAASRQEYYSVPAFPALALLAGDLLARADVDPAYGQRNSARRAALTWSKWLLVPITTLVAIVCGYFVFTAPHPAPGADLSTLLNNNPDLYNLSLGHLYDLTGAAMGLFRGPLAAVAIGMATVGLISYVLRRANARYAANLTLAAGMVAILLAAHEGLVRFNPILGSKGLALDIVHAQQSPQTTDLILVDGELTAGSTLLFYTRQPAHFINGRVNGLWFGSFWPDAPNVFEDESTLRQLWPTHRRIFLLTGNPTQRMKDLTPIAPVHTLASAGGKTILTNFAAQ